MHLAETFIQREIAFKVNILSVHAFPGNETHDLAIAARATGMIHKLMTLFELVLLMNHSERIRFESTNTQLIETLCSCRHQKQT